MGILERIADIENEINRTQKNKGEFHNFLNLKIKKQTNHFFVN